MQAQQPSSACRGFCALHTQRAPAGAGLVVWMCSLDKGGPFLQGQPSLRQTGEQVPLNENYSSGLPGHLEGIKELYSPYGVQAFPLEGEPASPRATSCVGAEELWIGGIGCLSQNEMNQAVLSSGREERPHIFVTFYVINV